MSLEVKNTGVTLGGRILLSGISFKAERGELLVLAGPNGAGKTTLLKAIACLVPSAGHITWDGERLADMAARDRARRLAYLPQGHVAHWPIPGRDAVAIGRAPFSSSLTRLPQADQAAIDRALQEVEASAFAGRPITQLSGGERARIMLARAFAVEAPLLLADEPTASLDPAHQLAVMSLLKKTAKAGNLVIAVIHDLVLANRFADKLLVLDNGQMAGFGRPETTLTRQLMRAVFHVESLELRADNTNLLIPWRPAHE